MTRTSDRTLFASCGFTATGRRVPRERAPSRWNDRLAIRLDEPDRVEQSTVGEQAP